MESNIQPIVEFIENYKSNLEHVLQMPISNSFEAPLLKTSITILV